ncbi:hypothetical protein [Nocardia jiangxiensis]|nr:hypothetical protein [Nocardia jiangxiensis]
MNAVFAQREWMEDEIGQAQERHPEAGDLLWHCDGLCVPTHRVMSTEFVYRSHVRELLERVAAGGDTRPGTAAEVAAAMMTTSLATPLDSTGAGLYLRMWRKAGFPPVGGSMRDYYEDAVGPLIDAAETTARRKLAVTTRTMGTVTCTGHHAPDCHFADLGH